MLLVENILEEDNEIRYGIIGNLKFVCLYCMYLMVDKFFVVSVLIFSI